MPVIAANTALELIDSWAPVSSMAAAGVVDRFHRGAREVVLAQELDDGILFAGDQHGMGMLGAHMVRPHVDGDMPPWSALWVLEAGRGHEVFVADHVPKGYSETTRRPLRSPMTSAPATPGSIILLNVHRTHWLPAAEDRGLFLALTHDFHSRPTREEVEEAMGRSVERALRRWCASEATPGAGPAFGMR